MANFLRFLLFLVLFAPCLADESWDVHRRQLHDNGATKSNRVICAFPLSEQYGLTHRLLYYVLTIVAASGAMCWPVLGAQLYVLSCLFTAGAHALKLAGYNIMDFLFGEATRGDSNGVHDMDVVGIWAVASVGCLLGFEGLLKYCGRALCPKKVRRELDFCVEARDEDDPSDRPKYLTSVGSPCLTFGIGCSVVLMLFEHSDEAECRSSTTNELMTTASQLLDPSFNCTYSCFARELPRGISEITVIPKALFFDHFFLIGLAVVTLFVGRAAFAILVTIDKNLDGDSPRNELIATLAPWLTTFTVVVLNEVYLLAYGGGFPSKERAFSIGQWGPLVSVLLCLLPCVLLTVSQSGEL